MSNNSIQKKNIEREQQYAHQVVEFVRNVMNNYYENKLKYKKIFDEIDKVNIEEQNNIEIINKKSDVNSLQKYSEEIRFVNLDKTYKFNVLGIYNNVNNIFTWSWIFPKFVYGDNKIVRLLFDYITKLDEEATNLRMDIAFMKNILFSSRLFVENSDGLEFLMALSLYIIKNTDECITIVPHKKYLDKNNKNDFFITVYILREFTKSK